MRAHTGALERISRHGIDETGAFATFPPSINLFSLGVSSGSCTGEL
jgi:hypothetical protein